MQRNMYWYHYCNDLLEILAIHPLFSGKYHFEVLWCQENHIWCAFNGLESAYIDFFYSVKYNKCTQKAVSIEM